MRNTPLTLTKVSRRLHSVSGGRIPFYKKERFEGRYWKTGLNEFADSLHSLIGDDTFRVNGFVFFYRKFLEHPVYAETAAPE